MTRRSKQGIAVGEPHPTQLPGDLPGGRVRGFGEVYGNRPASQAADLHGDGTWPGDDQAGSAGPPPGFEPDDPEGIPDPVVPPTDPLYHPASEGPPVGFEPPDPDAPPPPEIPPTDPAYQGPDAVTPPGFEPPDPYVPPAGPDHPGLPPEPPPEGNGEDTITGASGGEPLV